MIENQSNNTNELALLNDWISKTCASGPVPVLTGMNGDMDTIGSAIALAASSPNMVACGLHQGRVAKRVCERYSAPFRKILQFSDLPKNISGVIIVDAASPSQIGINIPDNIPKCIIDHHVSNSWELNEPDLYVNMPVSATTEIVANYLKQHAPKSMTKPVRALLLAGLLTDSGRFRHNQKSSFDTASLILANSGIDYAGFVEWLEASDTNSSERGSLLRGLQRTKATESGSWSIIHSNCGTLEGKLAGLLLGLGHDISLVSRNRDGMTRMTARATNLATSQGISLAEIMSNVALQIGGEGGGHDGAAGWSGKADMITAESSFISNVAKITRRSDD